MKPAPLRAVLAVPCLVLASAALTGPAMGASAPPAAPPYAIAGPLREPRIFAPDIVSTPDDEFGGSFSPDGETVYFDKSVLRHYLYVILESHSAGGGWSAPSVAPFSGIYRDSDPVLSPDGSKLYFVSDRPVDGKPKTDYDIWVVTRTPGGWGEPRHLDPPINSEGNEFFASAAANGDLYFTSDRPGGKGQVDVYESRFVDGKYGAPENLGDAINSAGWESDCLVAPDGSYLLVATFGRPDSYGNYDLYVSYKRDGVWTPVKNLGPKINTPAREYSPRISPDGKYLFFTSEKDFATEPPQRPLTTEELERGLKSLQNGAGNIYQIDLSAAGVDAPPK